MLDLFYVAFIYILNILLWNFSNNFVKLLFGLVSHVHFDIQKLRQ